MDDQTITADVVPDTSATVEACRHLILVGLENLDAVSAHLADLFDPLLN